MLPEIHDKKVDYRNLEFPIISPNPSPDKIQKTAVMKNTQSERKEALLKKLEAGKREAQRLAANNVKKIELKTKLTSTSQTTAKGTG